MLYTYEYDASYDPAMPVVDVEVRRAESETGLALKALVDSGADGTLIPAHYLKEIKARKAGQKRVRGVSGFSYVVDMYVVSLFVGDHYLGRMPVVADRHNQEMVLGRDALNRVIVILNGPAGVVEISVTI